MMFRPIAPIATQHDLGEQTVAMQEPRAVVAALDALVPGIAWEPDTSRRWFGVVTHEGERYEFSIDAEPNRCWTIYTSHRATERRLVPEICRALGLIAFDGQAMEIVSG